MDLAQMLDTAVENDKKVKVLTAVMENTLLGIERARLAPGTNLTLSTGDIRTSYSAKPKAGDPEWIISFEPEAALLLGRKCETEISAELPVSIGLGPAQEFTVVPLPAVAIRQPLDKIFNGKKFTEAQDRQNRYAAEKSRIDILKRVKEIEQSLLTQLSEITALERKLADAERALEAARVAREEAVSLQTYAAGSAQERKLEFSVSRLERQVTLFQKRIGLSWRELERVVGSEVEQLPETLPEVQLKIPHQAASKSNPDVYLASLAVETEQAKLEEERKPAEPKFFIGSALGTSLDEDTKETTTQLAGTVEGEFEDLTFTAGVGGILETQSVFVTFGFNWSFPDKQIESMNLEERENDADISRWNFVSVQQIFVQNRELLELEVADLEYRSMDLDQEKQLAELELDEGLKSRRAGLITEQELDELRWQIDKLNYKTRLLKIDRLLVASRLDALTALESE